MKLWGAVFGALIGWLASDFEFFGLVIGGFLGLLAGIWLETIVRREVVTGLKRIVDAELRDFIKREISAALGQMSAPPQPAAAALPPIAAGPVRRAEPSVPNPAEPRQLAAEPVPISYSDRPPIEPPEPAQPTLIEQGIAAARDWLLGGNTIVRAGLVILFVGLSFLARYAANAGLFPIELRLALVAAVGVALLVVGFNRREQRPAFGLALQGGGVAVLYLTVFAAARLFELMPPIAAFGLMIVFCGLGCTLALMQNSKTMAISSFAGGFAVPVLLGGESETPLALFTYLTILNLAILMIAWRRSWRALNLLGFFATVMIASAWGLARYSPEHYLICQIFLALSVLIYLATAVLYAHNTPGKFGNYADSTLLFGPAIAGFGLQVGLVERYSFGSAFSALAFGAAYVGVAAFTMRKRRDEMRLMNECLIAIGVGFVTLAIPLALDVKWTSAAWALEGAAAFWVGSRQARWMPRLFGLLLQALAALIFVTTFESNISALPLANNGFIGGLLITAALLATAWWMRRELAHSGSGLAKIYAGIEFGLKDVTFLAGFLFACLTLALELTRQLPAGDTMSAPVSVFAPHLQVLLVQLAVLAAMWGSAWTGRRHDWAVAIWPSRVSLPLLAAAFLITLGLGRHVLDLPDGLLWLGALALHYDLLRRNDATHPALRRWQYAAHAGTVWLLTAMLADCLQLGIDRGGLWNTSWAGVIFLISGVAVLMGLTRWAGRAATGEARHWPLNPHGRAYYWVAAVPLAVLVYFGALVTAIFASGVTDPLPYIPLLNPVDLSLGLALVSLALWRRAVASAVPQPASAEPLVGRQALVAGAALGFVSINGIWLRTAHHWLGTEWSGAALSGSPVVQTGLSILWTLLAMALMLLANRRASRIGWLTGAGLLAVVVVKLLLVDMSSAADGQRIVTFIGVGILMLVIGYFVPLPPRKAVAAQVEAKS